MRIPFFPIIFAIDLSSVLKRFESSELRDKKKKRTLQGFSVWKKKMKQMVKINSSKCPGEKEIERTKHNACCLLYNVRFVYLDERHFRQTNITTFIYLQFSPKNGYGRVHATTGRFTDMFITWK